MGLGTLCLLPSPSAWATDAEEPSLVGRIVARPRATTLGLSLYLTASTGMEVAADEQGRTVLLVQPRLHWGDTGEAVLELAEGETARSPYALRSGPAAWQTLAAGVEMPMGTVQFAWPSALPEGTPCRLVPHCRVPVRGRSVAVTIPSIELVARTRTDLDS